MDRKTRIFLVMFATMAAVPLAFKPIKRFTRWVLDVQLDEAGIITFIIVLVIQAFIFFTALTLADNNPDKDKN